MSTDECSLAVCTFLDFGKVGNHQAVSTLDKAPHLVDFSKGGLGINAGE